jgi:hypothetical protein
MLSATASISYGAVSNGGGDKMETEVKESRAATSESGQLAQVINEWRDCRQEGEQEATGSTEELSAVVNGWRDCGGTEAGS